MLDCRKLRAFNVIDDYNRVSLTIDVDLSLPNPRPVREPPPQTVPTDKWIWHDGEKSGALSMAKKRFSVEQIIGTVRLHEDGMSASDICRKPGIAEGVFYRWKKDYSGWESDRLPGLK